MKRSSKNSKPEENSEQLARLALITGSKSKTSKYRNQKTTVDGFTFDSKKEAERYGILKLLKANGNVFKLWLQRPYKIEVNGNLICKYIADFDYWSDGKHICEDCKGFRTAVYRLKKKLMKAVHGIEIREI